MDKSKREKQAKDIILFGVILLSVGLPLLYIGLRGLKYEDYWVHWQKTKGRILSASAIDESYATKSGTKARFVPNVKYEYILNDRAYTSNRLSNLYEVFHLKASALKVMEQYPIGAEVDVYYNPHNPSESFLRFSRPSLYMAYVFMSFSLIFIFCGGICFVFHSRYRKEIAAA